MGFFCPFPQCWPPTSHPCPAQGHGDLGTVFVNNRTQAVRLSLDVRLPEGVHKVEIRVKGHERIIAPVGQTWDSFFLDGSVTNKVAEFERVPALEVENWVADC